jgi:acyl-CoA thioesterase-1
VRQRVVLLALLAAVGIFLWNRHGQDDWPIANAPPVRPGIVCFGDSLTTGAGIAATQAYPALLPAQLGLSPDQVISRGVDGRTISQARRDVGRDVLSTTAGTVVILLGGNDMLRQRSPEAAMEELEEVVDMLHRDGRMVALCDFSPVTGLHRGWARAFEDLARRRGCLLVPSVADGLYAIGDGDFQSADLIHLNAQGQRVLAERIAQAIRPHLGGRQTGQAR